MGAHYKAKKLKGVLIFLAGFVMAPPLGAQTPAPTGFQTPVGSPTSTPQSQPAPAVKSDDFNYYKKYGHTSGAWNGLVKDGFDAYDQQDCEKAISFLKEAVKAGCDDPIVLFKLAACSEATNSYYSAAQYYKQAEDGLKVLKAPHRYQQDFYEAYGRTLYMNKKPDEAITYFVKAAEMGTPSFSLFYFLGSLSLAKKDNQKALEYFNKALTQPLDGAPPQQLGTIYGAIGKSFLELKDWDKAIQYLDMGLKLSPTDGDIQQARYKAGEMKRQEELFKVMQSYDTAPPPLRPMMPKPLPQSAPAPSK